MKTRYLILKKYDSSNIVVTNYKYYDGEAFKDHISKAFYYPSQQDARKALKAYTGKGTFQIEPIYIK